MSEDITPTYPDVHVTLAGTDGNVFAVIAKVAGALRRKVGSDEAKAFAIEAMDQPSYDDVLRLSMRTVTVDG